MAVFRHGRCLEHVRAKGVLAREAQTRAELRREILSAERKIERGEPLTAREAEVLESDRIIKERFGGEYPRAHPRSGLIFMDRAGNVVDRVEVDDQIPQAADENYQEFS